MTTATRFITLSVTDAVTYKLVAEQQTLRALTYGFVMRNGGIYECTIYIAAMTFRELVEKCREHWSMKAPTLNLLVPSETAPQLEYKGPFEPHGWSD